MPTPKTFYKVIPFLRGSIALLTLGCFITLLSYPKHPGQVDFNVLQQLALNAALLFSYSYSLYTNNSLNRQPLSPIYRMSLICTAFVLSWVYGMGPLVKILGGSDCKAEAARGGCMMQLSVSIIEVVWTMLMFAEGLLTDKRNRDKTYRQEMGWAIQEEDHVLASRARAAQAAAEANGIVEYRPDLSLESAGGARTAGAGRRRVVGVDDDNEVEGEEMEMEEPLPPYMPKAQSNQAVIIDMTNVRRPRQQGQQAQEQQELAEGGDHPSSHEVQEQGQEDTQGQQERQVGRTASRLGGVSMSSSSSSSTIAPPPAQLPPLLPAHQQQQQQQQHPDAIHPQGGPGTGLPRVPSYSE